MRGEKAVNSDVTNGHEAGKSSSESGDSKSTTLSSLSSLIPMSGVDGGKSGKHHPRKRLALPQEQVWWANLQRAIQEWETNYLTVARMLAECYHSADGGREQSLWSRLGYKSFESFVMDGVGWAYRRAYAMVAVADCCEKYKVSEEDAREVKSSKMAVIAAHAKAYELGRREVMACIRVAKETPWGEFIEWIAKRKEGKEGQDKAHAGRGHGWMRLKMGDMDLAWAEKVINQARGVFSEVEGVDPTTISKEGALVRILREWAETRGVSVVEEEKVQ